MATERQLQFRVGLLVLVATSVFVGLVVRFGDTHHVWKKGYSLTVQLENGAGLYPAAPVTLSGLTIGSVRQVELNQSRGGVSVRVEIHEDVRLPIDSRVVVTRSLMGESAVEFIRGAEKDVLQSGGRVVGVAAADPLVMIQRLETRTLETLSAFGDTSQEWQHVAKNLNSLMETKRGNLDEVVERAAESLHEFSVTMRNANQMIEAANQIVADPGSQRAMKEALTALPKLVGNTITAIDEIRQTGASTRQVLESMNRNLVNLSQVTEPVGKRGEQIVAKLDSSLTNIDQLLTELNRFAKVANQKDGSLQKFLRDPSLYDNLERSSESVMLLMRKFEPIVTALSEFSDKLARNPALLGVEGVVNRSKGLRDAEIMNPPAKRQQPQTVRGKGPN